MRTVPARGRRTDSGEHGPAAPGPVGARAHGVGAADGRPRRRGGGEPLAARGRRRAAHGAGAAESRSRRGGCGRCDAPPPSQGASPLNPLARSASAHWSCGGRGAPEAVRAQGEVTLRAPAAARGIAGELGLMRTVPGRRTAAHGHGCRAPESVRRKRRKLRAEGKTAGAIT